MTTTSTRPSPTPRPAGRPAPTPAPAAQRVEVSGQLKDLMRRLKLGRLLDTLPERFALARTQHLSHHEFLQMLFADEVTRRDQQTALLRARVAHLDPTMVLEAWDDHHRRVRPAAVGRVVLAAVPRRGEQRADHGPGRSGQKRSWPTSSGTPQSGAATARTSNAPTKCSNGSARPGSITPMRSRCASCTVSSC